MNAALIVTGFAELPEETALQTVTTDAVQEDLILPTNLDAMVIDGGSEAQTSITGVTWQSVPPFDPVKIGSVSVVPAGTYKFMPALPVGYDLADNAGLPVITVEVKAMKIAAASSVSVAAFGELQSAISAAAAGDTIDITADITATEQISISKKLTINGNGHTISVENPGMTGSGLVSTGTVSEYRIFYITGGTVTINDLTLLGGRPGNAGGAISVGSSAEVYLNSVQIMRSGGADSGYRSGGGIYNNKGTLYLNECNISRNAAQYGGGFLNEGFMVVENSTFCENRSLSTGGGGGAGENSGTLFINNCTFANNKSTELGGAINDNGGTAYILNSTFTGNVNYNDTYSGGAVRGNKSTLILNCIFAYNYSVKSSTVTLNDSAEQRGNVTVYNSILHGTTPDSGRGELHCKVGYAANGADNTLVAGGALTGVLDADGSLIVGTDKRVFQPFLYNIDGKITPVVLLDDNATLSNGSTLPTALRTLFHPDKYSPVVGFYDSSDGCWYALSYVDPNWVKTKWENPDLSYEVTTDQLGGSKGGQLGAANKTGDNLYMLKLLKNTHYDNGTVSGLTIYGDVYSAGKKVSVTAKANDGYVFDKWLREDGTLYSTSAQLTITVSRDLTIYPVYISSGASAHDLTLTGPSGIENVGSVLKYEAALSGVSGNPGKTLTFFAESASGRDDKTMDAYTDADGKVTFDWNADTAGTYSVYAYYLGDSTNKSAMSATTTVTVRALYSISLDKSGTQTFAAADYGYATKPSALPVTVHNTGSSSTGSLTVALSGANPSAFTLSQNSLADIAVGDSDVNAFTVQPNTGLAAGTYTATVTVSGSNGIAASFTVRFTVNPKNISGATVTAYFDPLTYNGSAQTPTPKKVEIDGEEITGYTVGAYSNNINAGTASVVINCTGNFSGMATVNFTISPKALSSGMITVSAQPYTGNQIQPSITVTDGGLTLALNTDYDNVTYGANVTAGTGAGSVSITGKGNYSGTVTANFDISKAVFTNQTANATVYAGQVTTGASLELPATPDGASYPASGIVGGSIPALISAHSISGGTLTYSTSSQSGGASAEIIITVNGGTNYNDYTVTVTINAIAKTPVNNTANNQTITYSGGTYDVSTLFNVDVNAGTEAYTLETGGTGGGSLNGTTLTVTRAGTFNISLVTAETANYAAGAMVTAVLTVNKGSQNAPSAPTLDNQTGLTITLTGNPAMEFSSDGSSWYASSVLGGLSPNTQYNFYQRLKETDLYSASGASPEFTLTTPYEVAVTAQTTGGDSVAAQTLYGYDGEKVTIYYSLSTPSILNEVRFKRAGGSVAVVGVSGKASVEYTVTAAHAVNGVITLDADFVHDSTLYSANISVTPPAKGATPQNSIASGTYYDGSISWVAADNPFAANTKYKAVVTLTAKGVGAKFASTFSAAINGNKAAEIDVAADGSSVTFSYTFPATGAKQVTGFTITDPTNTSYWIGDALNLSGLALTVSYDIGTPETIAFNSPGVVCTIDGRTFRNGDTLFAAQNGKKIRIIYGGTEVEATGSLSVDTPPVVKAWVTDITDSGAVIKYTFDKGTHGIQNVGVSPAGVDAMVPGTPNIGSYTLTGLGYETEYKYNFVVNHSSRNFITPIAFKTLPQSGVTMDGAVKDDPSLTIVVTLENGNTVIASVNADEKPQGSGNYEYSFTNVQDGIYNLVVDNGSYKVTQSSTVSGGVVAVVTVDMAVGKTQSVVDIRSDETPPAAVGGLPELFGAEALYTPADQAVVNTSGTVEMKLSVEKQDDPDDKAVITSAAASSDESVGLFLDISVIKSHFTSGGELTHEEKLPDLGATNKLTIVFELPSELSGKTITAIYRTHDGTVDTLTTDSSKDEYFVQNGRIITLYAHKFSTYALALLTATVSFNPNGGSGSMASATVVNGESYILPANQFSYSGHTFDGWKINNTGSTLSAGTPITVNGSITLYAQWTRSSNTGGNTGGGASGGGASGSTSGNGNASDTVMVSDTVNGSITVSPDKCKTGDNVSVTVEPDAGYELDALTITDKSGNAVTVTDNGDGTFTYTQPDGGVTVTVSFKKTADTEGGDVSVLLNTIDHAAYVGGIGDGRFAPDANMTRAEAAQIFFNLLNEKNVTITKSFPDSADNMWYTTAVNTLASLGIFSGYPDGGFHPGDSITRAEFATIAVRLTKASPGVKLFDDVPITHWAFDSISTAANYGWVSGVGRGKFEPDRNITRAEAVTVINRMLGRYPDKDFIEANLTENKFADVPKSHWAFYEIMEASTTHEYEKEGKTEVWKGFFAAEPGKL